MNTNVFERKELKYLVTNAEREMIEKAFSDYMNPDAYGESTICNIYYDTPDYRLIRHSLSKPIYKEKLRVRSYGQVQDSDTVFLELKKKYKGIVYKRRISLSCAEARRYLDKNEIPYVNSQIAREINYFLKFYRDLKKSVYLCYDRTAYYGKDDNGLRITFDRNIRFREYDMDLSLEPYGRDILDNDYSLMEIKAAGAMPVWLVKILSQYQIRQTSFSKYGRAYMIMQSERGKTPDLKIKTNTAYKSRTA